MAKIIQRDIDLRQNAIQKAVAHPVSSFPANAREGQMIYHTTFKAFFICKNDVGDTTSKGHWGVGNVTKEDLYQTDGADRLLVSNATNGFDLTGILDTGTF
ncbi:MAG: hypothetical protein KAX49_13685 [Halanaerobiales bacterium]|nr:hypothetical protein [Halanaerobiales bacterium]